MKVEVWVCKNCGSYYASSNAGDLSEKWNLDKQKQPTFRRSLCPTRTCADEGIHRIPVQVEILL